MRRKKGNTKKHMCFFKALCMTPAPRVVTKAFPVNAHSSVLPGAEVEIEKEPMHLDAT